MKTAQINISDCMHYRAMRYGGFGQHIYEDYIIGLHNGVEKSAIKMQFINRILGFDGSSMASILNIPLSKKIAPWQFPWQWKLSSSHSTPQYTPSKNPDIVCHYSSSGILASHINREFFWLERALDAIKQGYSPEKFGYIKLVRLNHSDKSRYIVLDGNHRLAALSSLGIKTVKAQVHALSINKNFSRFWPGVISRQFTLPDAEMIFDRFFIEKNQPISEVKINEIIFNENLNV